MVANAQQKRTNNNNRKRGAKFEKTIADMLEMVVVPYSGSNSRFGFGDVRDSEDRERAIWLGECKNIDTDGDAAVTVERKWLGKNEERAKEIGCLSFLAFMEKGQPNKYIMIDEPTYNVVNRAVELGICRIWEFEKKSHNTKNLIIPVHILRTMGDGTIYRVSNVGDQKAYILMKVGLFMSMLRISHLHAKYGGEKCSI